MTSISTRTWRRIVGTALLLLACLAVGLIPQSGHADNSGNNPPIMVQPDTTVPPPSPLEPTDSDSTQTTTTQGDLSLWDLLLLMVTL